MALDTVAAFNDALAKTRLLEPDQLTQLARVRVTDPRALAKELVQRGYLTVYQVNQLFQGHGRELVLGPYVLLDRLGEGGMGQVYKARHQKLGRVVAIKVIRKEKLTDPKAVERFRREIKAVSQMSHPNVIKAFDADQIDDAYFLTMEYAEGIDLGRLVKDKGPLPVADACEYIRQAAQGLQHAHECALVHRDIKPTNLLLTRAHAKAAPLIKLLDLGLARLHWTAGEEATTLTRIGTVVGTPEFMAPEQARNSHQADIRSDLYSLGCTFYYLLGGLAPITGETSTETLMKQCFEEPRPIEEIRPDVPARVRKILNKLLAKNPDERYQTPAKLVQALSRPGLLSSGQTKPLAKVLGLGRTEPNIRGDAPERLQKVARKRRWLRLGLIGSGLLLGLVLVVLAGSLVGTGSPSGRQTTPEDRTKPVVRATEPAGRGSLDALEARFIPAEDRFPWQPKELVAVLGTHHGRSWGTLSILVVSPAGDLIAAASLDGQVQLLETSTLKPRATLREEGARQSVGALAFSSNGDTLAVGHFDGAIVLYDVTAPQPEKKRVLRTQRARPVHGLAFSPAAPLLVSAHGNDRDDLVRLWDLTRDDKSEPTMLRGGHDGFVQAVAFSHDGRLLASVGRGGGIRLWDVKGTDASLRPQTLQGNQSQTSALAFSAKGDRLISFTSGRFIGIWDVADGKLLANTDTVRGGGNVFAIGALSRDGQHLATIIGGGPVHLWDLSGPVPRDEGPVAQPVQGTLLLALSRTARTLVSFGYHRLQTWDIEQGKARPLAGPDDSTDVEALALSRDGRTLATGSRQGRVNLWDLGGTAPARRASWDAHTRTITALQFSPDGKFLASGSVDARAALWDLGAGNRETARLNHNNSVTGVVFSPDSRLLYTSSVDRSVRIYDIVAGQPRVRPEPLAAPENVLGLALDPAGRTLAGLVRDSGVRLWDVSGPRGQFRADLRLLTGKVFFGDLAFSQGGKLLAVATPGGTIRLFEMTSPEPRELPELALPQGRGMAYAVAFSPDGYWLAAGYGNALYVWDIATKKTVRGWDLPGPVERVAFSPDSRHLATVNSDGTAYILRLSSK